MRSLVYGVAIIAAIGIMIGIATMPNGNSINETTTSTVSANVMSEPGTLVMSVPEMHCEFACFPKIKETLEASDTISEVKLAEQKEEGTIDNRQVIVTYKAGFDVDAALGLLESNGFAKSEVVQ